MRSKKATLVVNPRAGENVAKLTGVLAVLAAAGWKTDIVLKEYGGHTMELAQQAGENESDFVIAYGGDGTLSQVVEGVLHTKKARSIVGVIPGGTANVWAQEIGIPMEPIKAALSLINSEPRRVDIGYVDVQALTYPDGTSQALQDSAQSGKGQKKKKKSPVGSSKARHHFLLMAGLGIDAAILQHVSKPLKYQFGTSAVGLSAAKELPLQHAFPMEIHAADKEGAGALLWKGEALQVVIGNTRRYANIAEMTPDAHIDDGEIDICVITAGNPLTTLEQITSLLLRRRPDNLSAEYFHGAHLQITVPASVPLQLDGGAVKLKDYISKADSAALQQSEAQEHVMVTYGFAALPQVLSLAIPLTYDNALFEHSESDEKASADQEEPAKVPVYAGHHQNEHNDGEHSTAEGSQPDQDVQHKNAGSTQDEPEKDVLATHALLAHGRKVTVVGKTPLAGKQLAYIIAGETQKQSTGEMKPVAIVVNGKTVIFNHQGDEVPAAALQELRDGVEVMVDGKKSKRGVIEALRLML